MVKVVRFRQEVSVVTLSYKHSTWWHCCTAVEAPQAWRRRWLWGSREDQRANSTKLWFTARSRCQRKFTPDRNLQSQYAIVWAQKNQGGRKSALKVEGPDHVILSKETASSVRFQRAGSVWIPSETDNAAPVLPHGPRRVYQGQHPPNPQAHLFTPPAADLVDGPSATLPTAP